VSAPSSRRRFLQASVLSLSVPAFAARVARADEARPSLYVFVQLDIRPTALEKMLQARLPRLAVTVFGRYRDFDDALTNRPPNALAAIPPVLEMVRLKPVLQGTRGGRDTEPVVLVSSGDAQTNLAGSTIGVVDLMGQAKTQEFISSLLKRTDVKTKRVAKVEDLLPLIEFGGADAILLPASVARRLLQRTRVALKSQEIPGVSIGLTSVAVLNPAAREAVMAEVGALDAATNDALGVEGWTKK
jgi:hypothetical protein